MNMKSCSGLDFSEEYPLGFIARTGAFYFTEASDPYSLISLKHWNLAEDEFESDPE